MQNELKRYSILVAEDNVINQKVLDSLLTKWGFETSVVSNGLEVLEKLKKKLFDAIILDFQMPGMNGYETVQAIRQSFDGSVNSIPVLFLTSEINQSAFNQIKAIGIKSFLKKPVEPDVLFQSLSKVLRKVQKPKKVSIAKVHYLTKITDGNKELMAEIIGIFIEEVPKNIALMKKLCEGEDYTGLRKIIHKVRSNYKIVSKNEYELMLRDFEVDIEREVLTETYLARIVALEQITLEIIEGLTLKREKLLL